MEPAPPTTGGDGVAVFDATSLLPVLFLCCSFLFCESDLFPLLVLAGSSYPLHGGTGIFEEISLRGLCG